MSFEKNFLPHKLPELQKEKEIETAVKRKNTKTDLLKSRFLEDESVESGIESLKKVPNNPESKIEVYLERLESLFLHPDDQIRERNLAIITPALFNEFVIKPEQVSESYFELQKRIARERGQAVEHIPDSVRAQMIETIIKDQEHSLSEWVGYLSSKDAGYPSWFKYFAFRNILKLSQFDKELGHFKKRTSSTVAPFPDIYHESLARVADDYLQILENDPKKSKDPEQKAVLDAKFTDLYAKEIQSTLQASLENREGIAGKWIKYHQESNADDKEEGYWDDEGDWVENEVQETVPEDAIDNFGYFDELGVFVEYDTPLSHYNKNTPEDNNLDNYGYFDKEGEFVKFHKPVNGAREDGLLNFGYFDNKEQFIRYDIPLNQQEAKTQADLLYESLEGKGTGWCTAGHSTAQFQLRQGDFYVYYTYDTQGKATNPRIAIRMDGDQIGEVRGVLQGQAMEPQLQEVLDTKLEEFGDTAEEYRKKSADMKYLTEIDNRMQKGQDLTREDLRFLYQMDFPIQGFGYRTDPRIEELLAGRDWKEDMSIVFGEMSDTELVNILLEKGFTSNVIKNLERFDNFLADDIFANSLIKAGYIGILAENLHKFRGLSQGTANIIIGSTSAEAVLLNLDLFVQIDTNQIVQKLLENRRADLVIKFLDKLENISADIVLLAFIESQKGKISDHDLDNYLIDGLGDTAATALLKVGKFSYFSKNIVNFHNLSNETADRLIYNGYANVVADNLDKFYINRYLAKALFEKSSYEKVLNMREYLTHVNLDESFAFEIIRLGDSRANKRSYVSDYDRKGGFVAGHLDIFSGLTEKLAESLVELGFSDDVLKNVERFENVTQNEDWAIRLITQQLNFKGKSKKFEQQRFSYRAHSIESNIFKFHNLTKKTAKELLKYPYFYDDVLKNVERFEGFSADEELAINIIESGNLRCVADNLEKFEQINSKRIVSAVIKYFYVLRSNTYYNFSHDIRCFADILIRLYHISEETALRFIVDDADLSGILSNFHYGNARIIDNFDKLKELAQDKLDKLI